MSTLLRHPANRACHFGAEGAPSTLAEVPSGGYLGPADGILSTSMAIELPGTLTLQSVKTLLTW
jgi:hypothetical protein